MEERDHDAEVKAARVGATRFAKAVWDVIDYHCQEYYVSTAEIVGNIEIIKHDVEHMRRDAAAEDDDDGEAWKTCLN